MRWKIILLLNKIKSTCWADLVSWANGNREFKEGFKQHCKDGEAYCGKCVSTGRLS